MEGAASAHSEAKGESGETDPAEARKWWHVPDSQIEQLVRGLQGGAEHADEFDRVAEMTALPARTERRVRFHSDAQQQGENGDAIDQLLREPGVPASPSSTHARSQGSKKWRVSDEQLEAHVAQLAAQSVKSPAASQKLPQRSASEALLRGSRCTADASGKISITVFFVDSGDQLVVRVDPEMKLGPASPPPGNRFTDIFGAGASSKGFSAPVKDYDHRLRTFGATQRQGWTAEWTESFKGLIEHLTEIEPARQRLAFRNAHITADHLSLSDYGIGDGATVQLRIQKWIPGQKSQGRDIRLACTRRKHEVQSRQQEQEASGRPKLDGYSLRQSKHLNSCRADGDVWMMPKWISQASPNLFAPTGVGIDGMGGMRAAARPFENTPIYLSDAGDDRLVRVRHRVGRA